jgi:anti-sigma regulatory factor (Ser/Thr protein kinase)
MLMESDIAVTPREHAVFFYDAPSTLVERVVAFARTGLAAGEAVVIVATPEHRSAIGAALGASSADLVMLDAAETLFRFWHGTEMDHAAFDEVIGGLVRGLAADGRRVRAFGEMVALLWDEGLVNAAIELEAMWCDLRNRVNFELLCAYPSDVLLGADAHASVNQVCGLHSEVMLSEGDLHITRLRAYPAEVAAVRAARRFVAQWATETRTPAILDDVLLIASELSANAVFHAKTPFVIEVSLRDDALRIAVRDGYGRRPVVKQLNLHSHAGRGLAMIDALSARWGVDVHSRGKTVWAEVPLVALCLDDQARNFDDVEDELDGGLEVSQP